MDKNKCSSCGETKCSCKNKDFTKAVIEIDNPSCVTLFRKVIIPVSMGDDTTVPPAIGKYRNVLLVYEANNHAYLYSSDGIPTLLTSDVAQDLEQKIDAVADDLQVEIENRKDADTYLGDRIDTVSDDLAIETDARQDADTALDGRLTTVEGIASTALQPEAIDKVVMTDISLSPNTSTTTVQIDGAKENLLTGATTTKNIPLPVASHTEAGVMNSSTFDAVTNNSNNINALLNGAVAITGLSANPSQSDLTTAWEAQTGLTTLMNRAGVYDVTNNKVWTYYSNDTTWYAASNTTQVTINTFTNSSEGTILGSTNVGQIFAENDGTGSVNGWDALNGNVSTNTSNITSLQTAMAGKQDKLTAGTNITISPSNVISATNTTYTAGNAITIENDTINADIYPADFFTNDATDTDCGSDITLDSTIPTTLKSVKLNGDTEQQTYSGKNLWGGYATYARTSSDVDFSTNSDGSISMSGTASATAWSATGQVAYQNGAYITLTAGTYCLSTKENVPVGVTLQIVETTSSSSIRDGLGNFTLSATTNIVVRLKVDSGTSLPTTTTIYPMVEAGSTATSYEPYVGSTSTQITPSPNPDYPQDIHVVTGEQTVNITGKNLLNPKTVSANRILAWTSGNETSNTGSVTSDYIRVTDGEILSLNYMAAVFFYDKNKSLIGHFNQQGVVVNVTGGGYFNNFTVPSNIGASYIRLVFRSGSAGNPSDLTDKDIMVNEGSTVSPFEQYQSQSYTINLGSIALAKVGDYQDYIYKGADGWYVHKDIGKVVLDGSESWTAISGGGSIRFFFTNVDNIYKTGSTEVSPTYSNYFLPTTLSRIYSGGVDYGIVQSNNGTSASTHGLRVRHKDMVDATAFQTWLSTHNTIVYYALDIPTDTKITNSTLINQLNGLGRAKLFVGENNVLVSATGDNLPLTLCAETYNKSLSGVLDYLSEKDSNINGTAQVALHVESWDPDSGMPICTWTSDYSLEELASNQANIILIPDDEWAFCLDGGALQPDVINVVYDSLDPSKIDSIYFRTDVTGRIFEVTLYPDRGGSMDAVVAIRRDDQVIEKGVVYKELGTITLTQGATEIPSGTTIDLGQKSVPMLGSNNGDCPGDLYSWGIINLLYVRVPISASSYVTETCLVTVSTRSHGVGSEFLPTTATFTFNGKTYKMTEQSTSSTVFDIELDEDAPIITMTSTDPGEGVPLEANHFIGVYQ